MRGGPLATRVKTLLRRHVGIWVLFETRNKLTSIRSAYRWTKFEDAEVARLRSTLPVPRHALFASVLPTYRRPEMLLAAVKSALAQTIKDHVVIVVDDGGHELPEFPDDPRLTVVSLSRNVHVLGVVRNVGIRLTDSTYIAFLDDDNTWTPIHLESALPALASTAEIIYTALERCRADGSRVDILSKAFDRKALSDDSFVDANAIVVRRGTKTLFSRVPRGKMTYPKEDWELVYRYSRTRTVEHVAVPTVRYLVGDQSYYTTWKPEVTESS